MGGVVLIGPINPAGTNHVNRQLASKQGPHLYRRSMGAQHDPAILRLHEQGVLHGPCWMIRDEVERIEIHPLGLELRALGHLPAHCDEDVLHQAHQRSDGMNRAVWLGLYRQRDIDPLLHQDAGDLGGLELLLTRFERIADGGARMANAYARLLAGVRWQSANLAIGKSNG